MFISLPLLVVLAVSAMVLMFILGAANNQAQASDSVTGVQTQEVTVYAGDTLWSIASTIRPDQDVVETMLQISELNELDGKTLRPGQMLSVPVQP